jgi:hypothetical protein
MWIPTTVNESGTTRGWRGGSTRRLQIRGILNP